MKPEYSIDLSQETYSLLKDLSYQNDMSIGDFISEMVLEKDELLELDVNLSKSPDPFKLLYKEGMLTESDAFKEEYNE
ncbi:hypothetical protein [Halonatronum saccharophilum]|uniref:hypothetical protein n=1 Tax=Halonatronum saccharophilum TaxID=150060 RepID=UPI00048708B4|nr:hypothetical protein [Halonatronum saccharophilum]